MTKPFILFGTEVFYYVFVIISDGLTARFSGGNTYSDGMLLEEGRC